MDRRSFLRTSALGGSAAAATSLAAPAIAQGNRTLTMVTTWGRGLAGVHDAAQRVAALRLVRAALSEAGYDKASKIMLLEGVLRELEGEDRTWERDPEKYFLTIFGTPSDTDPWGLSFEGHHLSLNFVCRDGRVVDSTPQFFAANPGTIMNEVSGPLG